MIALAWPFVALCAVGLSAWLAWALLIRRPTDRQLEAIRRATVSADVARQTADKWQADRAGLVASVDELRARLGKLEMSRLGRVG